MKLDQFTQTNVVGVLERANEILAALRKLTTSVPYQSAYLDKLIQDREPGDDWEHASLRLAQVELLEVRVRQEDDTVEKFPANWAGGVAQQFMTTQPAQPDPDDVCPNCEYSAVRCECTPKLPHAPKLFGGNDLEKLSPELLTRMVDTVIARTECKNESNARKWLQNVSHLTIMRMFCEESIDHTSRTLNDMQQILDACKR